jgi:hypothetical protein
VETYTYSLGTSKSIAPSIAVGLYLSDSVPQGDAVVSRLLAHARGIQAQQPAVSKAIFGIIDHWPAPSIDEDLVKRIAGNRADAPAVRSALDRRDSLRRTVARELAVLSAGSGVPCGIATILLADRARESAILSGADGPAQRAVLASARLIREPLPVSAVGRLLDSHGSSVGEAAEAYLIAEDSMAARTLVLSRHRGEAVILGARQEGDPGHNTYSAFDAMETQLQKAARDGEEVYALLSAGYWGDAGQIVLRIRGGSATLTYATRAADKYERPFTPDELQKLREFVAASSIENLGPLDTRASDGMQFEYVHVSSDGGRRVFMNNPGLGGTGGSVYDRICDYFRRLPNSGQTEFKNGIAKQAAAPGGISMAVAVLVWCVWKWRSKIGQSL